MLLDTQLRIINLTNFSVPLRFRCGSNAVPVKLQFVVISHTIAIFKNVVHSLEPGKTPSYSASS